MTVDSGTSVETLKFYYDANGVPLIFDYNGTIFYYVTNLQGDVIGLADSYGMGASYTYDAWGNILEVYGIVNAYYYAAQANPLRYRGYIYDAETGFYYLQSRYYDPSVGRFINADGEISNVGGDVLGYNLFAYCFNNPVNMSDPAGQWPMWIGKAIAVVGVATVVVAAVAVTVSTFGAGSVAGVAAISAAVTIAARATEVAVLQVKKSNDNNKNDSNSSEESNMTKSSKQIVIDVTESLFDNGLQIIGITPFSKAGGIGVNHILNNQVSEIFDEKTTLNSTLSAPGGKVVPYAFAAYAWCKTIISIFSDDPVQRAEQRGYTLK